MGAVEKELLSSISYILQPKEDLTLSQWANKKFMLSKKNSSVVGKMQVFPWQEEPMDSISSKDVQFTVFKKSTRVGFTIILSTAIGYGIEHDPSNQLLYQSNDSEAKGFVKDTIDPMLHDNDYINKLIDQENSVNLKKEYLGYYLEVLGSKAHSNTQRRTSKRVYIDELDDHVMNGTLDSDRVTSMIGRADDFWDRSIVLGGKPIGNSYDPELENDNKTSLVDYWFKIGTQEHRHLPCLACGTYYKFQFSDIVWDKDLDQNGKTIKHYPNTARLECSKCGNKIYSKDIPKMDLEGKWVAENPEAIKDKIRSFHIWAIHSRSPNRTMPNIVKAFLKTKGSKQKLRTFYNEYLGENFDEDYEKVDSSAFNERLEEYEAQVPNGVLVLSFGVDTQPDRLECEVVGWGENEESWSIEYKIFNGDTSKPEVWKELDNFLLKTYYHENGSQMRVYCGGIDYGGHNGKDVIQFTKSRFARRVFAFKGASTLDAPISPRVASRSKHSGKVFMIGVNQAKDTIYSHLQSQIGEAGYMHFPKEPIYSDEYFKQLTAEQRDKKGFWVKKRARNEALDCRVYAYASLFVAGVDLEVLSLNKKQLGKIVNENVNNKRKRREKQVEYSEKF